MPEIPDNVLQFRRKESPPHEEFTAMLGEIEFHDPAIVDTEFEVRAIIAPSSSRYWIVVESDTFNLFEFNKLNKCFMSGTQDQVIRQWVRDSIHRQYPRATVTIV